MKTSAIFITAIISLEFNVCFLLYPFVADQLLHPFLASLDVSDKDIDKNLMQHAVPGKKCIRECKSGDRKVCYFNFTLKHYQVLGASCRQCLKGNADNCLSEDCVTGDGVGRGYLALNFKLPGPKIQVCKNDIVVVDLLNDADGSSTALHWHGMRQVGTQFMDGVPYLTQCPIPFGESFRYSFYAEDEGTHFYHSHAGHQKANGVYGAMIVRGDEKENPNSWTYDHDLPEHVIVMADWMHSNAEDHMPGLAKRSLLSHSILINGRGRYFNTTTNSSTVAPVTVFHVEEGKKYRFRLINAGINVCSFFMQIEDHNFTIIATEVSYVKPAVVNTLHLMSGERFDFVIDTNNRESRDYFIRFKQLNPCYQKLQGFAILRYHKKKKSLKYNVEFNNRTIPRFEEEYLNGTILNFPNGGKNDLLITDLEDYRHDPQLTSNEPDKTNFIFFDTPGVPNNFLYNDKMLKKFMFITNENGRSFIGTANNISFQVPTFPLLLETDRINDDLFCDEDNLKESDCSKFENTTICRCIHRIKFKLGSIAELVVVNVVDKLGHPLHLHGHKFHVVDMGPLPERMSVEEVKKAIPKRNLKNPPYKDTVILPYPGYARLRFRANNPGFWLFHCHFDWHLPIGMALMIQVGELDQMRKPPDNFPRCYSYMPSDIV